MSNKIETRTDTDRLTFVYSKFRTNLDDLVNLEIRLLNDDVPTMDEVRTAIDKVMDEQSTPKGVKNGRCNVMSADLEMLANLHQFGGMLAYTVMQHNPITHKNEEVESTFNESRANYLVNGSTWTRWIVKRMVHFRGFADAPK